MDFSLGGFVLSFAKTLLGEIETAGLDVYRPEGYDSEVRPERLAAVLAAAALLCSPGGALDFTELTRLVGNFSEVSPGIYRGARPTPDALRALASRGIRSDLDLQGGLAGRAGLDWLITAFDGTESLASVTGEGALVRGLGMTFFSAPLNSFVDLNDKETRLVVDALAFMHDPAHQPVFVHCRHGDDRTGMVVALYRVRYEGWTPRAAHDEMIAKGHNGLDARWTRAMDRAFWTLSERFVRERETAKAARL